MNRKFHISPGDICDLLLAKGKKFSAKALVEIPKSRGILCSYHDDREALAKYISRLTFDSEEIISLYKYVEGDLRREKLTSETLNKVAEYKTISDAVGKVQAERAQFEFGETFRTITNPNQKSYILEIEYVDIDHGKAKMLQAITLVDRIELITEGGKTTVRHPANEKCERISDMLISSIKALDTQITKSSKVDLSHIASAEKRNSFFHKMIYELNGMTTEDVISVKISNINSSEEEQPESEKESKKVLGFIRKATLEGSSIMEQKEYQELIAKGFFMSNVCWKAKDNNAPDSLTVEFEAGFSNQSECKGFKYAIKSLSRWESSGAEPSLQKIPLTEGDKLKYLPVLENASKSAFEGLSNDPS